MWLSHLYLTWQSIRSNYGVDSRNLTNPSNISSWLNSSIILSKWEIWITIKLLRQKEWCKNCNLRSLLLMNVSVLKFLVFIYYFYVNINVTNVDTCSNDACEDVILCCGDVTCTSSKIVSDHVQRFTCLASGLTHLCYLCFLSMSNYC